MTTPTPFVFSGVGLDGQVSFDDEVRTGKPRCSRSVNLETYGREGEGEGEERRMCGLGK